MIMKNSPSPTNVRQGPDQGKYVTEWEGLGLAHDRQIYVLPHWMIPFNILKVSTVNKEANKVRVVLNSHR